ncbi:MAG: hypothetical protein LBC20_08270 [Planctomycetaceae bacterium]|nr:hypothetical protein [Planctomycetaceae bacterium]
MSWAARRRGQKVVLFSLIIITCQVVSKRVNLWSSFTCESLRQSADNYKQSAIISVCFVFCVSWSIDIDIEDVRLTISGG